MEPLRYPSSTCWPNNIVAELTNVAAGSITELEYKFLWRLYTSCRSDKRFIEMSNLDILVLLQGQLDVDYERIAALVKRYNIFINRIYK